MRLASQRAALDTTIDRSGTIASAGVSQILAPQNWDRCWWQITNLSGTALWLNYGAAAGINVAGSFPVEPGETYRQDGSFVTSEYISIIGSVSGQAFTAKENSGSARLTW